MIIVKLIGGLGNQLFQYAAARCLAEKHQTKLFLDINDFEHYTLRPFELAHYKVMGKMAPEKALQYYRDKCVLGLIPAYIKNKLKGNPTYIHYQEKNFTFNPKVICLPASVYMEGFFQSEKYFKEIRHILLEEIVSRNKLNPQAEELKKAIIKQNAVSVHIRRGDYAHNKEANAIHGTCSPEYYCAAIDKMKTDVDHPVFYIFSDDMDWVKKEMSDIFSEGESVYMDYAFAGFEDMLLMSLCKHNIVANSSFSWWGGWLNHNPDKMVIAPLKWFQSKELDDKDLVPESWMRL